MLVVPLLLLLVLSLSFYLPDCGERLEGGKGRGEEKVGECPLPNKKSETEFSSF